MRRLCFYVGRKIVNVDCALLDYSIMDLAAVLAVVLPAGACVHSGVSRLQIDHFFLCLPRFRSGKLQFINSV